MAFVWMKIRQINEKMEGYVEKCLKHHPLLAGIGLFIGVPIAALTMVICATTIVALPISYIGGLL